jgi:hypothetical protein
MDDKLAFMELSALLTGLKKQILDDPEDRNLFEPIAEEYRNANEGLWPNENVTTDSAALIQNIVDAQALVMWPILFRRLATYFDEGNVGLGQFDEWIRDDPIRRDDTLRLPDGEKGNMHDTYLIDNDTLQLQFRPEDLLITPDPKPIPV